MTKIDVLAIGNEVLEGFTVNSNGAVISQALLKNGFEINRHIALPDDLLVLYDAYQNLSNQNLIVISTGGLGPTGDDLTRPFLNQLKTKGDFTELVIPNPVGSEPGVCLHNANSCILSLPGVPFEVTAMLPWVISFLHQYFPSKEQRDHGWIYLMRMKESKVDPSIHELKKRFSDLKYGIYPSQGSLGIHFHTPHGSKSLQIALDAIRAEFCDNLIEGETGKLEEAVFHRFIKRKLTLATAESCTGGVIASKLIRIPGASRYYLGGVVTYSDKMKTDLLGVDPKVLAQKGAVSEETVRQMAEGLLKKTGANYAVAVSGIAGPDGGSIEKPVGTVWYAIATKDETKTWSRLIPGNRELIIERSANYILSELLLQV